MSDTNEIDTLIGARWVIPVDARQSVLDNHAIAIHQGNIVDILPAHVAQAKYNAKENVDLKNHALIPGLINTHTHAAMILMRGLADDLPLMTWLNKFIWPTESRHVDDTFVFDGTRHACAEMLRGGITCFNDMYFFPEAIAQGALDTGMRASIGMIAIDFPTPYANDADDYLAKGMALRDKLQPNPLLSFCFAPHAPYTVSDQTLTQILTYAEQLEVPIHIHLHETTDEIDISIKSHGMRPIERLHQLGMLGPNLIAVHMVHLNETEIQLLQQHGCHVVHCPSSNLKLANGFAPTPLLFDQAVNVTLGTDGAASNNRLDLFEEIRLAALLAKATSKRADTLPAYHALEMATINGARALGIDAITGSLASGKAADITAIDFSDLHLSPCYDPVSHLVYAAGREQVSHVWVNGKILLENKQLTTLDEADLRRRALYWEECIKSSI
ncbi:TRZ/ATZ family hydrolase [Nitrosomonas marina]|uniref:5-methylthioadenosine/S-adenosylhomocysteine deaminase n=1 Tax=Nitrosomonas marina TaxID=917 RepID=A0A1H8CE03_9PROT|nr:TRZ/ATZ family hydrolase [Nitrosomonas marina]SEM93491.1 5-methylthioadenosine/S-adenosylhomocysteine deaminase [Nitrosomonas marina]